LITMQEPLLKSNTVVIKNTMKLLLFIMAPLYILSILRLIQHGWQPVMFFHTFVFLGILIFNFWQKSFSTNIQSNAIIACFILLGMGAILHNNAIVFGSSMYLIALIFTILFHSLRSVITLTFLLFLSKIFFLFHLNINISLQTIFLVITWPVLCVFAIYVVHHMRSTLEKTIEELDFAKNEAQKAIEAKSLFLATISHEIRTPLNGIILGVDLLDEGHLIQEDRANLEIVKNCSGNLLSLLNDVLDFSKVDAGKLSIDIAPVNLIEVASQSLDQFRNTNDLITAKLIIDEVFPEFVLTDLVRIRQIILNLLSNAFKFTKKGNVSLMLKAKQQEDQYYLIEIIVKDTGIGIDQENIPLLFQDFQQLDASITREFGGTGLGLWITKKLVTLLSGEISVDSKLGQGSTFTCRFHMQSSMKLS